MEITGPDRLHVASSINVAAKGLAKVESLVVDGGVAGEKLSLIGTHAIKIGTLLERIRPNLGNGVSGIFIADDGTATDAIELLASSLQAISANSSC